MADQPLKGPAEIMNSELDHFSLTSNHLKRTLQDDLIGETGGIPKRCILARAMPLYAQSRHDCSRKLLQQDIQCLIRTEQGEFKFQRLSKCQEEMEAGDFLYVDRDQGKGIHPQQDKAYVGELKSEGKWSENIYKVEAVAVFEERNHVTVLFSAKEDSKGPFGKTRPACHHAYENFFRVPLSIFRPSEQRKIYQRRPVRPLSVVRQGPWGITYNPDHGGAPLRPHMWVFELDQEAKAKRFCISGMKMGKSLSLVQKEIRRHPQLAKKKALIILYMRGTSDD